MTTHPRSIGVWSKSTSPSSPPACPVSPRYCGVSFPRCSVRPPPNSTTASPQPRMETTRVARCPWTASKWTLRGRSQVPRLISCMVPGASNPRSLPKETTKTDISFGSKLATFSAPVFGNGYACHCQRPIIKISILV